MEKEPGGRAPFIQIEPRRRTFFHFERAKLLWINVPCPGRKTIMTLMKKIFITKRRMKGTLVTCDFLWYTNYERVPKKCYAFSSGIGLYNNYNSYRYVLFGATQVSELTQFPQLHEWTLVMRWGTFVQLYSSFM